MTPSIPLGLCQCGCGQQTKIATKTNARQGVVKGQPMRFVHPHGGRRGGRPPIAERWREQDRGYTTPCHVWLLHKQGDGYGVEQVGGRTRLAHIAAWERAHGPVPDGHELHHLCAQRDCVRVDHLGVLTHADHMALMRTAPDEAIREARRSGERPGETMARLGIAQTVYYRALERGDGLGKRLPPGRKPR